MKNLKNIYLMPQTRCPACGKEFDAASALHGNSPSPGDVTVCIQCLHWMIFKHDMTVRSMTQQEIKELVPDEYEDIMRLTKWIKERKH